MGSFHRGLSLLVLIGALWGCAASSRRPGTFPATATSRIVVQVVNDHWSDMKIYLDHDGGRVRMGTINGMQSATFAVPGSLSSPGAEMRLVATAVGGGATYVSDSFTSWPGERLELTLRSHLATSFLSVRSR